MSSKIESYACFYCWNVYLIMWIHVLQFSFSKTKWQATVEWARANSSIRGRTSIWREYLYHQKGIICMFIVEMFILITWIHVLQFFFQQDGVQDHLFYQQDALFWVLLLWCDVSGYCCGWYSDSCCGAICLGWDDTLTRIYCCGWCITDTLTRRVVAVL